ADGRPQRLAREPKDEAPLPAESAEPSFLGRKREPLDSPAREQRRPAAHRQEGHRRGAGRPARARRGLTTPLAGTTFRIGGSPDAREDQARIDGRDRPFLHDDEEQAEHAREDGDQEIRSRRPQARRVQGNEDQVAVATASGRDSRPARTAPGADRNAAPSGAVSFLRPKAPFLRPTAPFSAPRPRRRAYARLACSRRSSIGRAPKSSRPR